MTTKLYLIRHGTTEYNRLHRLCGWTNPPLNKAGRRQAQGAAKALKSVEIDQIYHSGLRRAAETAEIIRGSRSLTPMALDSLREISFGMMEGRTMKEMEEVHPEWYQRLREDSIYFQFPEGESLYEMHVRVTGALEELIKKYADKTLVIISHAGVIRSIVAHFITGDINKHWSFKIDYCNTTLLEFHGDFCVLSKLNESAEN